RSAVSAPYGPIFIAQRHVPANPHPLSLPELQCYNLRPTLTSYLGEGLASWQKSSASHADKPEKPLQTLSSWESLRLRSKPRSASPVGKNGKACESWLSTSIKSIWVKRAAENSSRSRSRPSSKSGNKQIPENSIKIIAHPPKCRQLCP